MRLSLSKALFTFSRALIAYVSDVALLQGCLCCSLFCSLHPSSQDYYRCDLVDYVLTIALIVAGFVENLMCRDRAEALVPELHWESGAPLQLLGELVHLRGPGAHIA